MKDIIYEDNEYILNTYKRFNVVLESGHGAILKDIDGKEYIDFSSGIGTNAFGVCDEEWTEAVCHQAKTLQHTSNLYYSLPQVKLAKLLIEKTGMKKVFFSNSGAESNEAAIKAARKYSFDKYGEGRSEIITLQGSFHGRTIATLSATGQEVFHQYFYPFVGDFRYAPVNDISGLDELVNAHTCAIMIETVQGEGGVNALDPAFIRHIDKVCREKDIVFIVDEVQTGNGRCGYLYSYMEYGVNPNIVTTAKGLAGGLPFGAVLFDEKLEHTLTYGTHATTFGGNPICASAAYSILSRMNETLLNHVKECRKIIDEKLSNCKNVIGTTGKGLMIGIEIAPHLKAAEVVSKCIKEGLIALTAKNRIRLLPPLNISFEELEKGLTILIKALEE